MNLDFDININFDSNPDSVSLSESDLDVDPDLDLNLDLDLNAGFMAFCGQILITLLRIVGIFFNRYWVCTTKFQAVKSELDCSTEVNETKATG